MELTRYVKYPEYEAAIFRRTSPMILSPGGLWDESTRLYRGMGAKARLQPPRRYIFPSGAKVTFSHLQRESTVFDWQSSQIHTIIFEEGTHFEKSQFLYMMSRNRSSIPPKKRVIITCNPDPDSFVFNIVEPFLDENGLPDKELTKKEMFFRTVEGEIEVTPLRKHDTDKTVSFIPASLHDNLELLRTNRDYISTLENMIEVDRQRLLEGNWFARYEAGKVFNRDNFVVTDNRSVKGVICLGIDLASGDEMISPDSDFTAHVVMHSSGAGGFRHVIDTGQSRVGVKDIDDHVLGLARKYSSLASSSGSKFVISLETEPGGAGKRDIFRMRQLLNRYNVISTLSRQSKVERAKPLAVKCGKKMVTLQEGKWNKLYIDTCHSFPDGKFDDLIDASVLADRGCGNTQSGITKRYL